MNKRSDQFALSATDLPLSSRYQPAQNHKTRVGDNPFASLPEIPSVDADERRAHMLLEGLSAHAEALYPAWMAIHDLKGLGEITDETAAYERYVAEHPGKPVTKEMVWQMGYPMIRSLYEAYLTQANDPKELDAVLGELWAQSHYEMDYAGDYLRFRDVVCELLGKIGEEDFALAQKLSVQFLEDCEYNGCQRILRDLKENKKPPLNDMLAILPIVDKMTPLLALAVEERNAFLRFYRNGHVPAQEDNMHLQHIVSRALSLCTMSESERGHIELHPHIRHLSDFVTSSVHGKLVILMNAQAAIAGCRNADAEQETDGANELYTSYFASLCDSGKGYKAQAELHRQALNKYEEALVNTQKVADYFGGDTFISAVPKPDPLMLKNAQKLMLKPLPNINGADSLFFRYNKAKDRAYKKLKNNFLTIAQGTHKNIEEFMDLIHERSVYCADLFSQHIDTMCDALKNKEFYTDIAREHRELITALGVYEKYLHSYIENVIPYTQITIDERRKEYKDNAEFVNYLEAVHAVFSTIQAELRTRKGVITQALDNMLEVQKKTLKPGYSPEIARQQIQKGEVDDTMYDYTPEKLDHLSQAAILAQLLHRQCQVMVSAMQKRQAVLDRYVQAEAQSLAAWQR